MSNDKPIPAFGANKPAKRSPSPSRPFTEQDLDKLWDHAAGENRLRQPKKLPPARQRFALPSLAPILESNNLVDLWAHHKNRDTLAGTTKNAPARTAHSPLTIGYLDLACCEERPAETLPCAA